MPLAATTRPLILIEDTPWAVGFWMQVVGATSGDSIWVIATYECVEDLDHPNVLADRHNAVAIAESSRTLLEKAASIKFDNKGPDSSTEMQENKPVLKLHSYDLPASS
jgi:hypothetical protein